MEDSILFFWLVIAILFLILEMASPGLFYFLSFFVGALAAAGTAWFAYGFLAQAVAFIGVTVAALVLLRWWLKKRHVSAHQKTNTDALQGKRGIVIKVILPHKTGQATVGSEIWSARSAHNEKIEVGTLIEVVRVSGSHVVVQEIKR